MIVEKDSVGFVLPLTAGIFITTGLFSPLYQPLACGVSFTAMSLILLCLLHPSRKHFDSRLIRLAIGLLGLAVGIFMGLNSSCINLCSPSESALISWISSFGHRLGDAIEAIPFEESHTNAIIKALITGERNDIPRHVTEAFRDSGASHILALSGFHIGIIYSIVKWSLSGLGNSPRASLIRSVLIILLCGFYTLATGAGPSITRAFLFILLGEIGRLTHRQHNTATLILAALLIQLTISPSSIGSVSFQLSYAAMAGIAFIYPYLKAFWPGSSMDDSFFTIGIRKIWDSAAMSISCQLTTGPLAYIYFKSFPLHFLLTNLIALPLSSLIIPFALVTLLLTSLGCCPGLLIHITEQLVATLTTCLEIISTM